MGETIVNPLTGYSMTFLEATPEIFRFSEIGQPGAPGPVLHIHPLQEERFEVTRGLVAFVMDSEQVLCGPGEGVTVPAGVAHTFQNAGQDEFEMLGEYRPGLPEQSHRFHDVYFALARAGLTNSKGMPSIWQIAVEMPLVSDHVHLASPPWPIQRAFLALLRPFARLMGYKPFEQADEIAHGAVSGPSASS
jgi:mannose-6-phosphate isomerase-like protein (cupin superfamily)